MWQCCQCRGVLARHTRVGALQRLATLGMHRTLRSLNAAVQSSTALGGWKAWAMHPHALHQTSEVHSILCLRQRLRTLQLAHHTMAAAGRKETLRQVAGAVSQHATGAGRQGGLIQGAIVTDARQGVVHGVTQEIGCCSPQHGTNFLYIAGDDAGLLVRTGEGGWLHLNLSGLEVVLHRLTAIFRTTVEVTEIAVVRGEILH